MISVKGLAFLHPSLPMAAPVEHTHHIKIRSTQMEMSAAGSANRDEDYDRKLKDAQEELDRIQLQREELERKKSELEELTVRKRTFLSQQVELTEKLTSRSPSSTAGCLKCARKPRTSSNAASASPPISTRSRRSIRRAGAATTSPEKLEKASMAIDIASDEYDQAAAHFEGTRSGSIFGRASKRGRAADRLGAKLGIHGQPAQRIRLQPPHRRARRSGAPRLSRQVIAPPSPP